MAHNLYLLIIGQEPHTDDFEAHHEWCLKKDAVDATLRHIEKRIHHNDIPNLSRYIDEILNPKDDKVMYGIGVKREGGGVGMFRGPLPDLLDMLEYTPSIHLNDVTEDDAVYVYEFKGGKSRRIRKWSWTKQKWLSPKKKRK